MKLQNWNTPITRFLTAQTISLLGSSLVQYAIIWHITLTTSSGKMLTLSSLCGFLPQILISLFAGPLLDRHSRKYIIMLSDGIIAIATLSLALSFLSGCRSDVLLFIVLIIRSAGTGIQTPAVNAIIPQLVPSDQLMNVNGINSTLSSLIMFISPAISGAILSLFSIELTMFIDVITAVIGIGITSTITIPFHKPSNTQNTYLHEIKEGVLYLRTNHFISHLLIFQITILFLISPTAFLTPLLISRTFGSEVWMLTTSEMVYSLGMILGGILITVWGGFSNKLYTTLFAGALYGFLMIGIGSSPAFLIYLICNLTIGITSPLYNTPLTVTIQEKTAPQLHGRIFSLMQISTSCALPLGMSLFGPLSDLVAPQILMILSGILIIGIILTMHLTSYFKE